MFIIIEIFISTDVFEAADLVKGGPASSPVIPEAQPDKWSVEIRTAFLRLLHNDGSLASDVGQVRLRSENRYQGQDLPGSGFQSKAE